MTMTNVLNDLASFRMALAKKKVILEQSLNGVPYVTLLDEEDELLSHVRFNCATFALDLDVMNAIADLTGGSFHLSIEDDQKIKYTLADGYCVLFTAPDGQKSITYVHYNNTQWVVTPFIFKNDGRWYCPTSDQIKPFMDSFFQVLHNAIIWLTIREVPVEYVMATKQYKQAQNRLLNMKKPALQPVRYISLSAVKRVSIPSDGQTGHRSSAPKAPHIRSETIRHYKSPLKTGQYAGQMSRPIPAMKIKGGGNYPVTIVTK
jgi:hypothetical protein